MKSIEITQVVEADLPTLAGINRQAYSNELISRFAWKNWPNDPNMSSFYNSRVVDRFQSPGTTMYKAIEAGGDRIYGFIACTLEQPAEDLSDAALTSNPSNKLIGKLPPYMNLDFVMATGADVENMKKETMKDEKAHYYISAFAVHPDHHGQGIGSQLLKHCLQKADEASMRTWLIAFPMSHTLYLRSGFKDVDYRDADLNKWDRYRFRGFGLYRQYLMVREPVASS